MKQAICAFTILAVLIWSAPVTDAVTLTFTPNESLPVLFPDNNSTGVTQTFTVSGVPAGVTVNSVSLVYNLSHTWIGDLRSTLTSPDSEVHTLFYDIGDTNSPISTGDSSNLVGAYTLTDSAATTLWTAAEGGTSAFNIPAGSYRTTNINVNSATSIGSTFGYPGLPFWGARGEGERIKITPPSADLTNGTWTVYISDNAAGDTGSVNVGTQLVVDYTVPVAANASIAGRLFTADGLALGGALVTITNLNTGEVSRTQSSAFGNFRFEDLPVGNSYLITVDGKRFRFVERLITLDDDLTDIVMTAMQFS